MIGTQSGELAGMQIKIGTGSKEFAPEQTSFRAQNDQAAKKNRKSVRGREGSAGINVKSALV